MKFFLSSSTATKFFCIASALLLNNYAMHFVDGHGYMFEPMPRPYFSWVDGLGYGFEIGVPSKEYCAWCINTNTGVCGSLRVVPIMVSIETRSVRKSVDRNYLDLSCAHTLPLPLYSSFVNTPSSIDDWLDSAQQPMPWISQKTRTEGQIITAGTVLTAHHNGHIEIWICPQGRASTQECFKNNKLEFVDDIAYQMPKDPNHPECGICMEEPATAMKPLARDSSYPIIWSEKKSSCSGGTTRPIVTAPKDIWITYLLTTSFPIVSGLPETKPVPTIKGFNLFVIKFFD